MEALLWGSYLATQVGDFIDPTVIHSTLPTHIFLSSRKRDTKGGHKGYLNTYSNHQKYHSI